MADNVAEYETVFTPPVGAGAAVLVAVAIGVTVPPLPTTWAITGIAGATAARASFADPITMASTARANASFLCMIPVPRQEFAPTESPDNGQPPPRHKLLTCVRTCHPKYYPNNSQ